MFSLKTNLIPAGPSCLPAGFHQWKRSNFHDHHYTPVVSKGKILIFRLNLNKFEQIAKMMLLVGGGRWSGTRFWRPRANSWVRSKTAGLNHRFDHVRFFLPWSICFENHAKCIYFGRKGGSVMASLSHLLSALAPGVK